MLQLPKANYVLIFILRRMGYTSTMKMVKEYIINHFGVQLVRQNKVQYIFVDMTKMYRLMRDFMIKLKTS